MFHPPNFLSKISHFFVQHAGVLLTGALLAFLIISPSFIFPFLAGDSYRGVDIGNWDDYANYLTKGREILEGHHLGNWFLNIGKGVSADPHQVYVEYVLLLPLRFLGLAGVLMNHMSILYDAITWLGVLFLVLQIYFLVLKITKNKLVATAIAIFTVGGYSLVKLYQDPVSLYRPNFNMFIRPMMPLYGLVGLFVYLNVLVNGLRSLGWRSFVWPGIALGALFYVYPYTWSFALAVTGSLFLIYAATRNIGNVKKIVIIMVLGIVVGSYSLMRTITYSSTDAGRQILYFNVEGNDHTPMPFSKMSLLCLVLLIVVFYRNKKHHISNEHLPILFAIVCASFIALNQQVITGWAPQVMHYFWYFTIPTSVVVGGTALWELFGSVEKGVVWKYRWVFLGVVMVAAFINTAQQQYLGTRALFDLKKYAQNYRPIFDALNRDTHPGVILNSEGFYGTYLVVNTSHDLFWSNAAFAFNTPTKRIEDALYVYMYLDKNTRNNFTMALNKIDNDPGNGQYEENRQYPLIYQYLSAYISGINLQKYSVGVRAHNVEILEKRDGSVRYLSEGYAKVANPAGIITILKNSGVNYIVWDQNKNPEWDLSFLSQYLRETAASNGIHLYKIEWPAS